MSKYGKRSERELTGSSAAVLLQYFDLPDTEMRLQIERIANLSALLVLFFPRLLCEPLIIPGRLN
jgi:hypothetical protein